MGYGYWGNVIAKILLNEGFIIEKLFTSKKIFPHIAHCREVIPFSKMSIENIQSLTHLFVLTGAPFHHTLLTTLEQNNSINHIPLIWLEKPYIISDLQSNYYPNIQKNIYVDYPYSRENAEPFFLDTINRYKNNSCMEINVFSRHNNERSIGIIYDFMPHIVSLISFFVKDFGSLMYCNWSIDEVPIQVSNTNIEYRAKVYSFEAICDSDGNKYVLRFGIDNPTPSHLSFNRCSNSTSSLNHTSRQRKSTHIIKLSDAFKRPVDKNIRKFLSANQINTLHLSDTGFHDLVYQISAQVEFAFRNLE